MPSRAVILAGGKGSRLGPYTTVLPKPLLPIGDRAILDVVVRQLAGYGFSDLTLAVGYLSHLIMAVMGDGSDHGVRITYHEESEPLGTVGPLAMIDGLDDTFLAMNGDVMTSLDYSHLVDVHRQGGHAMTIASHQRTVHIDYGVLHVDDSGGGATNRIVDYEEKPKLPYLVSMGVYVFEPRALDLVKPGTYADIPDLALRLIDAGESVGSYLFDGYWLDIGRHDDYELAIEQYEELKPMLLKEESTAPTEVQP